MHYFVSSVIFVQRCTTSEITDVGTAMFTVLKTLVVMEMPHNFPASTCLLTVFIPEPFCVPQTTLH